MDTLGLFRVPANPNEDRSGKMLFIIILVTVMATIAVLLRFVTRRKLRQRVLADDCFSLAALVGPGHWFLQT